MATESEPQERQAWTGRLRGPRGWVAAALLAVVVAGGAVILVAKLPGRSGDGAKRPKELWFQCEKCGYQWAVKTPPPEGTFVDPIGRPNSICPFDNLLDCPKCGAGKSGLQMMVCPKCAAHFLPAWKVNKEPVPPPDLGICPNCGVNIGEYVGLEPGYK